MNLPQKVGPARRDPTFVPTLSIGLNGSDLIILGYQQRLESKRGNPSV